MRYRFFQYCTQMEHLDKDSTVPTPGSLTLSAVVVSDHWKRTRRRSPSNTGAHQEAALGFLSDTRLFTSAAQGSHLWSSETRKAGSAYILWCNWYGPTSWEVLNVGWAGWVCVYVQTCTHSAVYNFCTVWQWLRTNGLSYAEYFNFQFIFWCFCCCCLFSGSSEGMWLADFTLSTVSANWTNSLNFHINIILVSWWKQINQNYTEYIQVIVMLPKHILEIYN